MIFRLGEWPGFCAPKIYHPHKKIDRGGQSVDDFFKSHNVEWTFDLERADVWIRKPELSKNTTACFDDEKLRIAKARERPTLLLMAEPREHCPVAYALADPRVTMAVAPGREFKMLYDRGEWVDPQLEGWSSRLDKACFIGRPTPERVKFIQNLVAQGVDIDILSRSPWPLPQWKGPAEDDVVDARRYKFRFVFETTLTHLCHSEKLFLGIRSGCVTFYHCDPELDLDFCQGSFVRWYDGAWENRHELAPKVIEGINRFMFSNAWEIYSYREHYRRIIAEAKRVHDENPLKAHKKNLSVLRAVSEDSSPVSLGWRTNHAEAPNNDLFDEGLKLASEGRFIEALAAFQRVRDLLSPGELPGIVSNMGLLHVNQRRYQEADEFFRLGLAREPDAAECLLNYGVSLMNQGRHREAIAVFLQTYKNDSASIYRPENVTALLCRNLGLCYAHLGQNLEAEKFLKEALHITPENIETTLDLACVYLVAHRRQEGELLVNRVLQWNSQHERALQIAKALLALPR